MISKKMPGLGFNYPVLGTQFEPEMRLRIKHVFGIGCVCEKSTQLSMPPIHAEKRIATIKPWFVL